MIWLTWRQFRGSAALVLGALALAAVALAVTGPQLADILRVSGEDFFTSLSTDDTKKAVFMLGTALAYVVPAVIGTFWGAPMIARELEAGTYRLVWNQSITRTQWLVSKLGIAAIGAVVAGCDRSRDDVVGRAPRRRGAAGLHGQQPLQRPPPLAGRLRLARGRADRHGGAGPRRRRHRRTPRASNGCGHGPHPCDGRRRPDPDAGVRCRRT